MDLQSKGTPSSDSDDSGRDETHEIAHRIDDEQAPHDEEDSLRQTVLRALRFVVCFVGSQDLVILESGLFIFEHEVCGRNEHELMGL